MRCKLKFATTVTQAEVVAALATVAWATNNLELLGVSTDTSGAVNVDYEYTQTGTVADIQGSMLAVALPSAVAVAGALDVAGASSLAGKLSVVGTVVAKGMPTSQGTVAGLLWTNSRVVTASTV